MTTSTEPTVYTSGNDHRWMKGFYALPEQTAPPTTGFIAQGSSPIGQLENRVLVGRGSSFASLVADVDSPAGNWTLLWRLEDVGMLALSSISFPHLAFADDGEIKFIKDQEGIHFYPDFHDTGAYYHSTDPPARMPENHRTVPGTYAPPAQPEFFKRPKLITVVRDQSSSLAPVVRDQSSSLAPVVRDQSSSLAPVMADFTSPADNWMLLWRLKALERRPESERWPAAEWPSGRAFEDARTFIHALPVSSIPLPHLSFADDGEINFLWNQDGIHIDLGFYGTGTYSYFARGKADEGFYADNVPASDGMSDALVALLGG